MGNVIRNIMDVKAKRIKMTFKVPVDDGGNKKRYYATFETYEGVLLTASIEMTLHRKNIRRGSFQPVTDALKMRHESMK